MNSKCLKCTKLARYVWLDEESHCFACSNLYTFADREIVFKKMIAPTQGPYTWEEWHNIAHRIKYIDMGCRFDINGCTKKNGSDPRACCSGCAKTLGYLKAIPEKAWPLMMNTFDEYDGFWRPDGCILPWQVRSPICLSYRCANLRRNENKELWSSFYKAIGLGEKKHIEILKKLPRSKLWH